MKKELGKKILGLLLAVLMITTAMGGTVSYSTAYGMNSSVGDEAIPGESLDQDGTPVIQSGGAEGGNESPAPEGENPVPQTGGGTVSNCVQIGTAASLFGHMTRPLAGSEQITGDEYFISFDYMAPSDKSVTYYYIWRGSAGGKAVGPEIQQINKDLQINYGSTHIKIENILEYDRWMNFTLHYSGNEFSFFIDGMPVEIDGSYILLRTEAEKIQNIGPIGDLSSGGANGYACYDNIRVIQNGAVTTSIDFNDGSGEQGNNTALAQNGWVIVGDAGYAYPVKNCPESALLDSISIERVYDEFPANSKFALEEVISLSGFLEDGKKVVPAMGVTVFTSSDPAVMQVVEESGRKYIEFKESGECVLNAACTLFGVTKTAEVPFKVSETVSLTGIGIKNVKEELPINQAVPLEFVTQYSNGLMIPIAVRNISGLSVESDNPAVVAVEQGENSVVLKPLSEGEANITLKYSLNGVEATVQKHFNVYDKYWSSLHNPSFENGTSPETGGIKNWTKYSSDSKVELASDKAYEGTYSVKLITPKAGTGNGLRSDPVKVKPGVGYRARGFFYNESGIAELYLEFWNESGKRIGVQTAAASRTGTWFETVTDATAPAETAYATVLLYHSSSNVGTSYADAISLEEYTPVEVIRDFPIKVSQHPRLFFTPEELPDIRAKAADTGTDPSGISGKAAFDALKLQADAYMAETSMTCSYYNNYTVTYPLPPQQPAEMANPPGYPESQGVYPYWTAYCNGLQDRLEVLSMAYIGTNDTKYADKAIEYVTSVAKWDVWSDPKYAAASGEDTCLDTAHLTMGVATVYDLLYGRFGEEDRAMVLDALIKKGLEKLYVDAKKKVDHNIQMLRAAALGTGACAVIGETDQADKWLTRATEYYKWYMDERMESGNQEGIEYTSYGIDTFITSIDQIARVTGVQELVKHPFLDDFLVQWVVNFAAPGSGTLPDFSDSVEATYFYPTMSIVNKWNQNGLAGWYLADAKPAGSLLEKFLYSDKNSVVTSPENLSGSRLLPQIGWGAMRTGWGQKDTLFAIISNMSGLSHNHYDQNSFQIASNGVWLASDPGYADFVEGTPKNEFTMKMGHSTILVDGIAQSVKGTGSLVEKIFAPGFSYMVGSAPNAYGSLLSRFDRHAILINHADNPYYIVMDDLKSGEARTYTWNLYSGLWNQLAIGGSIAKGVENDVQGNSIAVQKLPSNLYVQFVGNAPFNIKTGYYRGSEGPAIQISNPEKADGYQFMAVINAAEANGNEIFATNIMKSAVTNNSNEIKTVTVNGSPVMFFRGAKAGDAVTLDFDVKKTDSYDVDIQMVNSPAYGQYKLYIDGVQYGDAYEGYASDVKFAEPFSLGSLNLSAGRHKLTLECTGKNTASSNYFIGLKSIQLKDAEYDQTKTIQDSAVKIAANIVSDNVLGAKLKYSPNRYDIVLFNRSNGELKAENVSGDAAQISVLGIENDTIKEGFAITEGKSFIYNGRSMLTSEKKINAFFDYSKKDSITGYVNAAAETGISLYGGDRKIDKALLDGNSVSFSYDAYAKKVSLTIPAGKHSVSVYGTTTTPLPSQDPEPGNETPGGDTGAEATTAEQISKQIDEAMSGLDRMSTEQALDAFSLVIGQLEELTGEEREALKGRIELLMAAVVDRIGVVRADSPEGQEDVSVTEDESMVKIEIGRQAVIDMIKAINRLHGEIAESLGHIGFKDLADSILERKKELRIVPGTAGQKQTQGESNKDVYVVLDSESLVALFENGIDVLVDSTAALRIPAGAIDAANRPGEEIEIAIREIEAGNADYAGSSGQGLSPVSSKFGLSVTLFKKDDDPGNGTYIEQFRGNLLMSLPLGQLPAAGDVADSQSKKIGVYRFNPVMQSWDYAGGRINGAADRIELETDHLSTYGAFIYNKTFEDIEDSWAKEYIEVLASRHVVNGIDGLMFEPERSISRAEFAKMLTEALGLVEADSGTDFADVNKDAWYYKYVGAAQKLGIVTGMPGGAFEPDASILRQDIAVMARRAAAVVQIELADTAADVKAFNDYAEIDSYAREAVEELRQAGILAGNGERLFLPKNDTTRAEAAKIIYMLLYKLQ